MGGMEGETRGSEPGTKDLSIYVESKFVLPPAIQPVA